MTTTKPRPVNESVYADTGCDLNPRCLTCPLAKCVEDYGGVQKYQKTEREVTIRRYVDLGAKPSDVARHLGVTVRTVRAAIR